MGGAGYTSLLPQSWKNKLLGSLALVFDNLERNKQKSSSTIALKVT